MAGQYGHNNPLYFNGGYMNNNNLTVPNPGVWAGPGISIAPQSTGLIWVNGEDGARNYPIARGNTLLLLDSQDSLFYLKSMDLSGNVSIRKFQFSEMVPEEPKAPEEVDSVSQLSNSIDSMSGIIKDLQDRIEKFEIDTVEQMRFMEDKLNRLDVNSKWKNKKKENKE